jgi:hypothetical protein
MKAQGLSTEFLASKLASMEPTTWLSFALNADRQWWFARFKHGEKWS